ncbi:flagellar protein FlaG [Pseudoalteromonas sp. GB56]
MADLNNVLELNLRTKPSEAVSNAQQAVSDQEVTGLNIANDKLGALADEAKAKAQGNNAEKDVLSEGDEQSREQFFEEIRENLKKLNEYIPLKATNLIFEFDEIGDPPVVKVIDRESEETIREIPPREFRDVAKALEEFADKLTSKTGVLFNKTI